MTTKTNTFESGQPSPTDVTMGNSAFPDALQDVVRSAAGTYVRYTNAAVAHGSLGIETGVGATAGRAYAQWSLDNDERSYFRINAVLGTPTSNHRIVQFGRSTGSCMDLELRTDRRLRLRDAYSRNYHETQPLPEGLIRIECMGLFREGDGSTGLRVYTAADTWELFDSFDGDLNGTLRGTPTYLRWGVIDNSTNVVHRWDDASVRPDRYPGPVVRPNLLPTAQAQYRKATFGAPITLTTTGSDPDGGTITYAYSYVAGSGPAGTNVQIANTADPKTVQVLSDHPGTILIRCTMNDGQGGVVDVDHCLEWENVPWVGTWPILQPAFSVGVVPPVSEWGDPIASEQFLIDAPKGQFLQKYPLMDAYPPAYKTTHGGEFGANNGDHYGGNTNLYVSDGVLSIELYREAAGTCIIPGNATKGHAVGGAPYAKFSTDPDDIYQLYGRYKVHIRVTAPLPGWYTAFLLWPESEQWPRDGEIDWPEGEVVGTMSAHMHRQDGEDKNDQDSFSSNMGYTQWHTVVTEWRPDSMRFIVDDVLVGESTERVPNTPMRWAMQTETVQNGTQPGTAPSRCLVEIGYLEVRPYRPTEDKIPRGAVES